MSRNALAHFDLMGFVLALAAAVLLANNVLAALGCLGGASAFLLSFVMQTSPNLIDGRLLAILRVLALSSAAMILYGLAKGATA